MNGNHKILIVHDNKGIKSFDMLTHKLVVRVLPNAPHSVRILDADGEVVFLATPLISLPQAWRATLSSVGGFIAKEVTYNG